MEVVHGFELVQVDEQKGNSAAGSPPAPHGLIQLLCEQRTVGQAGEGVVESLVAELVFEDLLVGDVTTVEHQSAHTGFVDEVGDDRLEIAPRTIGMADPPIDHHFA